MAHPGLPPRIAEINDGAVTWHRLDGIDYEMLGYFLSCHLIIEHYLAEFLKIVHPSLNWAKARPTFTQMVALLSSFKISPRYDCVPAIKHMNALRNKLSHDIEFKMRPEDLLPLNKCLAKASEGKSVSPSEPKEILEQFTMMVCALFAGYISSQAHHAKLTRR